MRTLWNEDGCVRAVGARPRNDLDGIIAYFTKIFEPWAVHEDSPVRFLVSEPDQTVVVEVVFTGTTRDQREVRFDAVDIFDFADGRISRLTNWYDIDFARRSLTSA